MPAICMEEIPEWLRDPNDPNEYADIVILVFDLASMKGIDIESAVLAKMAINRKRTWSTDETGLFYRHTKEKKNGHTSET